MKTLVVYAVRGDNEADPIPACNCRKKSSEIIETFKSGFLQIRERQVGKYLCSASKSRQELHVLESLVMVRQWISTLLEIK